MCTATNAGFVQTDLGRRAADGTFTPDAQLPPGGKWLDRNKPIKAPTAVDVPMGDGLAGSAREGILSRRERIRRAVEGE